MTDAERAARASSPLSALGLFSVMWALAAIWHLLGNPGLAPAWAQGALAVAAGLVLLRPGAPLPLAVLAVAGLVTLWEEAPLLGNHWLLAGFVNLAILQAVVTGIVRRRPGDRVDLANRLFPAARLSLVAFYAFAAFAKLNTDFFDRSVSCAVHYYRESTDSVGLSGLQLGGSAWLEQAVILGAVAVELAIPLLLLWPGSRRIGVLVGLVFHALVAVDHAHQFFDFSSMLFALFVLFLPPTAGAWVGERVGSIRARLALRHERLPTRAHLGLVAIPVTAGLLVAVDVVTGEAALDAGWWPWQLYAVAAIVATVRYLRQVRASQPARLAPHHALFLLVPLLVAANGLTPYLELKTGYGWNMYANLRTVDGESNHFIARRTLPLTDEQADLVEIVDTDSATLARYAVQDYALTWRQLRTYLAEHPGVRITYRRAGETVALDRAADDPELVRPVPEWREKVQLFRAVDLREATRCVPAFGGAR